MKNFKEIFFHIIFVHFFLVVLAGWDIKNVPVCTAENPKVAIVGSGIGGAATSFFLSELIKGETCIHIYEANKVGGRLSEVEINGTKFESGGSIIHGSNMYMKYFMEKLGYKKRHKEDSNDIFGVYNGKKFNFIESSWTIINYLKLIWRYGFGLYHLPSYVDKVINPFKRIYDYQNEMKTFDDVRGLLETLNTNFPNFMTITLKSALLKEGFSERFIDEIVKSGLVCNYGQGTDVHQFVGTVSMAGMDSSLWAVEGGNSQIVKGLVEKSRANLIHARVKEIYLNKNNTFTLLAENSEEFRNVYDFIVIAAPLTEDALFPIVFKEFPDVIHVPGRYHRTVATILRGKLNYTYFGFASEKDAPNFIANVGDSFFNTVSQIRPVNSEQTENVWKIFSRQLLTTEQIKNLFYEMSDLQAVDWLAYPHYDTSQRNDTFILHKNLYYLNAVEWAASAMEMSSISAKNIALHIAKNFHSEIFLKNQNVHKVGGRDEL